MSATSHFQRVDELFRATAKLDVHQRVVFLDEQCGENHSLRDEVAALLEADAMDAGILDQPALGAALSLTRLAPAVAERVAPLPQSIGRYRILRLIGTGGMGVVYEAEQDHPRRIVALKVMKSSVATRTSLHRFEQEAQLLGRLQHPGIAQIFDAGSYDSDDGPQPFFAMEFVRGVPLTDYVTRHHLPVNQRLELIAVICEAVEHAHQRGVVHRDLKPSNILAVDEEAKSERRQEGGQGEGIDRLTAVRSAVASGLRTSVKILDFGVARASDCDVQTTTLRTEVGQLIGTVSYMSPEQAAGDPSQIDARSDVYSIGVIAYELLCGQMPYRVQDRLIHEAVRVIREDEPTPLSSVDRSLRGDIGTIVAKALEKNKARRYQTAAALAADIRRHLADQPITARPASAMYQLRKFTRRNKAIVGGIAAGFVLMLIGLVLSLHQAHEATKSQLLAGQKAAEATHQMIRATLAAASMEVENGNAAAAGRHLELVDPADRHIEWRCLAAMLDDSLARIEDDSPIVGAALLSEGRELLTLSRSGWLRRWDWRRAVVVDSRALFDKPVNRAAFSADGQRIAAVVQSDGLRVLAWESADSAPIDLGTLSGNPRRLELSPSGRWIGLAIGATSAMLIDVDSRTRRPISVGGTVQDVSFTADDRFFAAATQGHVQVIECAGGALLHDLPVVGGNLAIDCSADGSSILCGGSSMNVQWIDLAEEREMVRLQGHSAPLRGVRFVPNSSMAVSAGLDQSIRVWDLSSGRLLKRFLRPDLSHSAPRFDASGATFITLGNNGVVNVWDLRSTSAERHTVHHDSYVYAVAFSPDSTWFVTGSWDKTIRTWDTATCTPRLVMTDDHGFVSALAVSPDGRFIVSGHHVGPGHSARLRVWNAADGALVHDFPRQGGEAKTIVFDPGGQRFVVVRTHAPLMMYDLQTREATVLEPRRSAKAHCVAWSRDGLRIAACYAGGTVRMFAADTGDLLSEFKLERSSAIDCAFDPDGRLLATAESDGTVRQWDASNGECLRTLRGHTDDALAVAFTHDGSRLISGSRDLTIRIWDVATGDEMLQLRGHSQYVYDLALSPDGSMLLSGSGDGTARVWDTRPR